MFTDVLYISCVHVNSCEQGTQMVVIAPLPFTYQQNVFLNWWQEEADRGGPRDWIMFK